MKSRAAKGRDGRIIRKAGSTVGLDRVVLYGWHPVSEALRNPDRVVLRILATENGAKRLQDEGLALPVQPLDPVSAVKPELVLIWTLYFAAPATGVQVTPPSALTAAPAAR